MPEHTELIESSVYLIDEQYRIVHMNETLKKHVPTVQVGDFCYKSLCGEDAPCKNCPLREMNNATTIFYNRMLQRWEEINTGRIDWPGVGECHIIMAQEFRKENKNLLYNLSTLSTYDELYEINVTQDAYSILYRDAEKDWPAKTQGALDLLLREAVAYRLHPEDKPAYLQFWDRETLAERIGRECAADGALEGRFRVRKQDGTWGWVLQSLVPLRGGTQEEQVYLCFVQAIDDWKPPEHCSRSDETDSMTGLPRRNAFIHRADALLTEGKDGQFCLVALDIEHFKLYNEWYGQQAGDRFLSNIGKHLLRIQEKWNGLAGYMGEDNFVILLPNEPAVLTELQTYITGYMKHYGDHAGFLPAFGIYEVEDRSEAVSTMYDRAVVALNSVKAGNYTQRVRRYDAAMLRQMASDHRLLSEVQQALDRGEFTFYAQPKCNMSTGKIVGLESLVRWNHPDRGVIPPIEFVPLLESNGFITDLDRFVWEEVCRSVRSWLDKGYQVVPVSVNVSRMDIYTIDVVAAFTELTQRYELDHRLIELEITESAYVEEYEIIPRVVEDLRRAGFTVLMDDFGSGYSSLNMLKDVQVDVLKIDMKFLEMSEQSAGKGVGILEAIVGMARLMGMRFIAEGVETREQMEFLLNMGCAYGQGYYFYRPMPMDQLEPLLADGNNMDCRGVEVRRFEHLRIKDLLKENLVSETMMNNILGGIAFYDVCGETVELLQANEQYYRITGKDPMEQEDRPGGVLDDIRGKARQALLDVFQRAKDSRPGCAEGDVRRVRSDGTPIWIHLRAFFLREQDGHILCYGSVSDVTMQKMWEERLQSSQRELSAVVGILENDASFMRLAEENRRMAAAIFAQMTPGGMIGGYCEDGFPLYFANAEVIRLMGYDTYEAFYEAIDGMVINTIHPDDREQVARDLGTEYYAGMEYSTTYRMPRKDGSWFWTLDRGRVVQAEDGRLAIVSACTDISENMAIQEQLAERNALLMRQNQELQFLNNDIPGGYHRCARTPGYAFLYISARFLEIFGFTRQEIRELFGDQFINMVHPDDRVLVNREVKAMRGNGYTCTLEYRMLSKRGYIWVIDQSKYLEYDGAILIQGVVLDVTETVELRNRMQLLMENTPENIVLFTYSKARGRSYQVIANGLTRSLGYSLDEYEAFLEPEQLGNHLRTEDVERLQTDFARAVDRREDYEDVLRVDLPDGRVMWTAIMARFVKADRDGVTYLCICHDATSMKEKERELWLVSRQMESILRQAGINSWNWDISTDTLTVLNAQINEELAAVFPQLREKTAVLQDFRNRIRRWKSGESIASRHFLRYIDQVYAGALPMGGECEVPIRIANGRTLWIKTACETILDDQGAPTRAVGYYTDITREKEESLEKREIKKTLELLRKQAVYDFKANLTRNTFAAEQERERWLRESGCAPEDGFEDVAEKVSRNLILPRHREAFLAFMNRERLIHLYQEGGRTASVEYQRIYCNSARWMRMVAHLVRFEDDEDVYAYIFLMDIDEKKREELQLKHLAETETMTGLYNRQTAVTRIKRYLEDSVDQSAAMILFDLDNFKRANDVFGHGYGDQLILRTAETLKKSFREGDILCRLGGDEFLVLCKNIREPVVRQKLEQVVTAMHMNLCRGDQELVFSTSAGYVMIPEQGRDFEELYHKADIALFNVKMGAKGIFAKYDGTMKAVRYELAERE